MGLEFLGDKFPTPIRAKNSDFLVVPRCDFPLPVEIGGESVALMSEEVNGCVVSEIIDQGEDVPRPVCCWFPQLAQVGVNQL